jgi:hypothetical protein
MPTVDVAKLKGRYPVLLADSGGSLKHGIGRQRQPDSKDGACFVVAKTNLMGDPTVLERIPLTEVGWATAWSRFVDSIS